MPWKTITVPKTVWLPTAAADGQFKNTGLRVEPGDKIEIETGTSNIRVNGADHRLFISCDTLRLDSNNCLQLDKPAPPVANIAANGGDRAFVGRLGQAQADARGRWDQKAASSWKGDAATPIGKSWVEAQIGHAERRGDFEDCSEDEDPETTALFEENPNNTPKHQNRLRLLEDAEQRVVRTVTLKDGTTAEVLIDPSSGRQAGVATRTYSGPGVNPKEAARMMAEQAQGAQDVTYKVATPVLGGPTVAQQQRQPDLRASRAALAEGIPLAQDPKPSFSFGGEATPSGLGPIFDGFLEATLRLAPPGGFHRGAITFFQLEEGISFSGFTGTGWVAAPTCETAFARLHGNKAAGVVVPLGGNLTPEHVLDLAEHLPVLAEIIAGAHPALVLVASWEHNLLTRLPLHHLRIGRHATDPRFLTATLLRAHGQTLPHPKTVSWPERPPAPAPHAP